MACSGCSPAHLHAIEQTVRAHEGAATMSEGPQIRKINHSHGSAMATSPSKAGKTTRDAYLGQHLLGRVPAEALLARALDQYEQCVRDLIDARWGFGEGFQLRHRRLVQAIDRVFRGIKSWLRDS